MFANRIAIVTGGGSGIGRAVCQIVARESGLIVVADQNFQNANDTLALLNKKVAPHTAVQVDVSSPDSVKTLFEHVNKSYGSDSVATLLANCAGITRDGWMIDMSADDFSQVIDVNLKGTFLTSQQFCKRMIDGKKTGAIVNISSVSAKIGNLGQANYVASKSAVEGLTRNIAREMGRYNIRCNAVIPGFIETPMIETVPDKAKLVYQTVKSAQKLVRDVCSGGNLKSRERCVLALNGELATRFRVKFCPTRNLGKSPGLSNHCHQARPGQPVMDGIRKQTPLGRTGTSEEVAQAITFLLSEQSSYVTGTLIQVSGGFAI